MFCTSFMNNVFEDFQKLLLGHQKLCDLKSLRFDGSNVPDYTSPRIQRLYLLRYFPAYLVEYYAMLEEILSEGFLGDYWNVLSIGCGSGIDCYSISLLHEHNRMDVDRSLTYTGYDLIEWPYFPQKPEYDAYLFLKDITQRKELDEEGYNIIILPKSIGEIKGNKFDKLLNVFARSSFSSNRIVLACSFRNTRSGRDGQKFERLVQILIDKHNFKALDKRNMTTYFKDKQVALRSIYPNIFDYPDHIYNFITSMLTSCSGYIDNNGEPHKADCKDQLNYHPMMRASHFKWRAIRLERKEA